MRKHFKENYLEGQLICISYHQGNRMADLTPNSIFPWNQDDCRVYFIIDLIIREMPYSNPENNLLNFGTLHYFSELLSSFFFVPQ